MPVALRHCPFLRHDPSVVLLRARKSIPCGVAGTLFRVADDLTQWIPSALDGYSSYTKPRHPGMLAVRMFRKLRGTATVDPSELVGAP